MPATTLKKNQNQPLHEAGTTKVVPIDRNDLLAGMTVRVNGEANVTVAGTAVTDGPLAYVKDIAIKTASLDILRMTAVAWYRLAQIFTAIAPAKTDVASGTGVKAWSVNVPISFAMLRALVPNITLLPSWVYEELFFEITYGSLSDLYTGGTATLQNLDTELQKNVATEVDADFIDDPGVFLLKRASKTQKEVTATTTEFLMNLTAGRAKRAILLSTRDAGVYQDDIVNTLTLKRGAGEIILDKVSWAMLREINQSDYGIAMPTGWAVIDFAKDQDIADILDAQDVDTVTLEADVTIGAGTTLVDAFEIDVQQSGI